MCSRFFDNNNKNSSGDVTILPPPDFSGPFDLLIRAIVTDVATDGDSDTASSPITTVPIEVNPVADCVDFDLTSLIVVEDGQAAAPLQPVLGTAIEQNITIRDDGTENPVGGENNEEESEFISRVELTVANDFDGLRFNSNLGGVAVFNITDVSVPNLGTFSSGAIDFIAAENKVVITSSIFENARGSGDLGTLTVTERTNAETDIRFILRSIEAFARAPQSDENDFIQVNITTIDINNALDEFDEVACTEDVEVIVQAFADTPEVTIDFQPLTNTFTEDDDNATVPYTGFGGIPLFVNVMASPDQVDNSETLSLIFTVPFEPGYNDPIGTLSVGAPNSATFQFTPQGSDADGNLVYVVTTDPTLSSFEQAVELNNVLEGTAGALATSNLFFTPAPNFAGLLTGTAGIKVELISTEEETDPAEIALKSANDTAFIDIDILPQVSQKFSHFQSR